MAQPTKSKPKAKTVSKKTQAALTKKTATAKSKSTQGTKTSNVTNDKPRKRKAEKYRSFRLHRKIRPPQPKVKGAVEMFFMSWRLVRQNWRLFAGLTCVYAFLTLVLVRGFSATTDIAQSKNALKEIFQGDWAGLAITTSLFGALLGTTGVVSTASGTAYQSLLLVVMALATVWGLRQISLGKHVYVRETFYRGLYPLGVFVCVLFFIGVQLLPIGIGSWLYAALVGGGIVITALEKFLTAVLTGSLVVLSMYMVSSSLFALFISTLPDMTPMLALKSARQLVLHRRWQVMARIVVFLLALPVLSLLVMLPFILWLPGIAEWIFFILTTFGTLFTVTYMYTLYRELLNE